MGTGEAGVVMGLWGVEVVECGRESERDRSGCFGWFFCLRAPTGVLKGARCLVSMSASGDRARQLGLGPATPFAASVPSRIGGGWRARMVDGANWRRDLETVCTLGIRAALGSFQGGLVVTGVAPVKRQLGRVHH